MGREGKSIVQFVPADPNKTARVLDAAGSSSTKREVLILRVLESQASFSASTTWSEPPRSPG